MAKAKSKKKSSTSKRKTSATKKKITAKKRGSAKKKTAATRKTSSAKKKTAVKKKKVSKQTKQKVSAIPKGYHTITPYLIVRNALQAIRFYKMAFAAKEALKMLGDENKVMHAELIVGDAKFMLADEAPEMNIHAPARFGGSPVSLHLYVKDVDKTIDKAVSAGSRLIQPIENMFYGDRCGTIEDPYGHKWHVSTHIEDVTPALLRKRAAELFGKE
jgi:PhnB protein